MRPILPSSCQFDVASHPKLSLPPWSASGFPGRARVRERFTFIVVVHSLPRKGTENIHFCFLADHKQDYQPRARLTCNLLNVMPTYTHTHTHTSMYSNYWMGRHVPRKKTVAFLYIGLKSWFSGFCRININSYFRRGRYWYCWRPILAFFLSLYSIYYVLFSYFGYSFPAPILALFWLLSFCSPSPIIPNLFFFVFFCLSFCRNLAPLRREFGENPNSSWSPSSHPSERRSFSRN